MRQHSNNCTLKIYAFSRLKQVKWQPVMTNACAGEPTSMSFRIFSFDLRIIMEDLIQANDWKKRQIHQPMGPSGSWGGRYSSLEAWLFVEATKGA
jgi:menaquinone-dependent protoporphyrinogen IX oxidase